MKIPSNTNKGSKYCTRRGNHYGELRPHLLIEYKVNNVVEKIVCCWCWGDHAR